MDKRRAIIAGMGHAVPPKALTNHDLAQMVHTSDEWIQQRTGIVERRICGENETSSTLSIEASKMALKNAGVKASELDMIICATVTPDMIFPSTSCLIQKGLGAGKAGAFDIAAACAGFIYGLSLASALIETGQCERVLVTGVDTLSKTLDWTDRSTCVLFGDGAGAAVLTAHNNGRGILKTVMLADGTGAHYIKIDAGAGAIPWHDKRYEDANKHLEMAGAEVYRFAVLAMGDACVRALELAGLEAKDIDLFVPHQANKRIIDASRERLELPPEKVFINVNKYGNTSGGSIPIALSEASQQGLLKEGMLVMTVGFGAGLVWGANLIRW